MGSKKHAKKKQKWYIFSSLNGNLPFSFNMVHVCEWFKTMFENLLFFQWEFIIYFTYFIGKIRFLLYLHYYVYSKNIYIFHEKTSFSTEKYTISNNISSKDAEGTRFLAHFHLRKKCTQIHDKNTWKHVSFRISLNIYLRKNLHFYEKNMITN